MSSPAKKTPIDKTLADAIDVARAAAVDLAGEDKVGEHAAFDMEDTRLGTHRFACTDPGYRGWFWAVTLTRVPRGRAATICEVALQPGPDSLLAPPWVPYAQRLRPEDVRPGDTLPYVPHDERLVEQSDAELAQAADEEADTEFDEMGLGRKRVLSPAGRAAAAERWYAGPGGPNTSSARRAKAKCGTCGFLLKLSGSTRHMFGVCANEWSSDDGRVVSLDHGCGAHSETDIPARSGDWQQSEPVIDELDLEPFTLSES